MKQPTLRSQQNLVDKINARYAVGDKINVMQDDGTVKEWTVKNKSTILGGHTAVIWCIDHVGCYSASRVIFN